LLKKLSLATAIIATVTLAFAAVAPPASAQTPATGTVLAGRGVLDAHGTGLIAVRGNLDMAVSADEGILLVKDESGDAIIHVEGHGDVAHWNGFTVYFGFHGSATIIGKGIGVIVVGRGIDMHVAGRGWAFLKGDGRYYVNGRGPFPWNNDGGFASITPPDATTTAP
jgi:hypothetical protein